MRRYYSQNGEDAILWSLFQNKKTGFFIDVGALDGKRFSNTYSFEKEGWKGICIEAHSHYFISLKKNRPNSICVHAAISDRNEDEVDFFSNSRGSLSTLDPNKEQYFREHFGKYFTGFEIQRVKMRTLNNVLDELQISAPIDLVSIDVEGEELSVLKGFNLKKYHPRLLVIESIFKEEEIKIKNYLRESSYIKVRKIGPNLFYCRDKQDIKRISITSNHVPLCHTKHPMDKKVYMMTHQLFYFKDKLMEILFAKQKKRGFDFFKVGFHGDKYLLHCVDVIIRNCEYFIETGTNVGTTLAYMGRTFPHIKCMSCEPDNEAFNHAIKNTSSLSNVTIFKESSQKFILRLKRQYSNIFNKNVLFWLDSHGYGFKWPLKKEIRFITTNFKSSYILIDDFKVPELDCFGYDKHKGQECSFEYIKDSINAKLNYSLYYPNYTDRTSKHHPLRGWGLIVFGHDDELKVSDSFRDKIRRIDMSGIDKINEDSN